MRHILLLCGLLNTTSRSILPKAVAKSNIELLLKEISRCCNSMMTCDYLLWCLRMCFKAYFSFKCILEYGDLAKT